MKDEFFVSICPSTDSDIISRIFESAKPASFLMSKTKSRCLAKNRQKLGIVKNAGR